MNGRCRSGGFISRDQPVMSWLAVTLPKPKITLFSPPMRRKRDPFTRQSIPFCVRLGIPVAPGTNADCYCKDGDSHKGIVPRRAVRSGPLYFFEIFIFFLYFRLLQRLLLRGQAGVRKNDISCSRNRLVKVANSGNIVFDSELLYVTSQGCRCYV